MSPVRMFGINAKREVVRQLQCTFSGIEPSAIPLYHLLLVMNFSRTNYCMSGELFLRSRLAEPTVPDHVPKKVRNGYGAGTG